MKKFMVLLFAALLSAFATASANNFYEMVYSDITVCINHYNIPSFAVNGTSVVVVDDLVNYGMSVSKQPDGSFRISAKANGTMNPMQYELDINQLGSVAGNAQQNLIPVYIGNKQIVSYNMNGYTFIPVEELKVLGDVYWVPEQKALKLWIEGLPMKQNFEPAQFHAESLLYRDTMAVANAYIAANDYEQALSALDWTMDTISEDSSYYTVLRDFREEIAYITATNNINICIQGGNMSNAAWNAYYYLEYYCTYNSPYYNALATKYAETTYIEAINNINIHLKKRDYYSAYVTASNAKDSLSEYTYENNDSTIYYQKLSDELSAICRAWKNSSGSDLVIVDYWAVKDGYNSKISMKVINLSNKTIRAFKCSADICDVFGSVLSNYYDNHTLYVDSTYLYSHDDSVYTWNISNSKAVMLRNLKVTQVVFYD